MRKELPYYEYDHWQRDTASLREPLQKGERGKNSLISLSSSLPSFSGALHWPTASESWLTRSLARLASLYKQQSQKEWRMVLEEKKKDISPTVIF